MMCELKQHCMFSFEFNIWFSPAVCPSLTLCFHYCDLIQQLNGYVLMSNSDANINKSIKILSQFQTAYKEQLSYSEKMVLK